MAKGCYRNCVVCNKEFYSFNGTQVCSEGCRSVRDSRTNAKCYRDKKVKEALKLGKEVPEIVNHYHYKQDREEEVEELKRLFSREEKMARKSCMFCPDVNSVHCGRAKWEGRITGGCWKKVPDERCRR